jgi:peptide/nickel transport system permease protein
MVVVVFGASILIFMTIHLIPGDPVAALLGENASEEMIEIAREEYGFNDPMPKQYYRWAASAVQGDFGVSVRNKLPVTTLIGSRVWPTIHLATAAMFVALLVGLPLGILAAAHRGGIIDRLVSAASAVSMSLPFFWIGILAILLFSLKLGWLPPGGRVDPGDDPIGALKSLILPATVLAANPAAILARFTRTSMIDKLDEDYIRTARAKGVSEAKVVLNHAFRNALIPILTMIGVVAGRAFSGAVVIEVVFAWPGLGRLLVASVDGRDYAVIQGLLLLVVVTFLFINLIVDVAYGLADPRIRQAGGRVSR